MTETTQPASDIGAGAYRVLARKYRPQTFDDLIGQEPMVRTIRNGFESGRIPQAWMLTGVRGVGKTTTARILARALNYEVPGKVERPTIDMPEPGIHCEAIMASRHVDVIEMDAASHTGIDDIREITDASRYMPASARYKVYIIDEVHMLSKQAFNGLLKTLEEPPAHVKFIFATTEIRKVPVTVLSRCQRFDLRRIEREALTDNLAVIAEKEGVAAERAALGLIAEAAEGSVRDAQSLLDQAIAHGAGEVRAESVATMLGLVDRGRIVDLFETLMGGKIAEALDLMRGLYTDGADPVVVLRDLAALTHQLTEASIVADSLDKAGLETTLKDRLDGLAKTLAVPHLSRAWQILLKGISEVETAPRPIAAADMVLVRLAYAADLPTPDDVLKRLNTTTDAPVPAAETSQRSAEPAPVAKLIPTAAPSTPEPTAEIAANPTSFDDVVALAREKRDGKLLTWLERSVRLVTFEPGRISLSLVDSGPTEMPNDLSLRLSEWTGRRWMVAIVREGGEQTVHEKRQAQQTQLIDDARQAPDVAAILDRFPGAEIVKVDVIETPAEPDTDLEENRRMTPNMKD